MATAPTRPLGRPPAEPAPPNGSHFHPRNYSVLYDCHGLGAPLPRGAGGWAGCTSQNRCAQEAAAHCDALGGGCGGFGYSDMWDQKDVQFAAGAARGRTNLSCDPAWDF